MNRVPVNPRTAFKQQMTKIRKQFALQHMETTKKQQLKLVQRESLRRLGLKRLNDDISTFKQQQKSEMLAFTNFDASRWAQESLERKAARRERHLAVLKEKSDAKMAALVHLYHAAADFCTYQNLDEKIDQMLRMRVSADPIAMRLKNAAALFDAGNDPAASNRTASPSAAAAAVPDLAQIRKLALEIQPAVHIDLDKDIQRYEQLMRDSAPKTTE